MSVIKERYEEIKKTIPQGVTLLAATKGRTTGEIEEAVKVGIEIVGENYVQEAVSKYKKIEGLKWHIIGHLQRNKAKDAIKISDCIQSVDSLRLAKEIDQQCARISKIMPVFIEVNIGNEESKSGANPDEILDLTYQVSELPNLRIEGMMTMEPFFKNPEEARPYLKRMKQLFDEVKSRNIPNTDIKILSMGMSNSYQVAIEEGSNMVRIGTKLFGPR
ncbi:MAG: dependent protein [Candidatus Poribacteria bacterium]|nr:dependent protein [Candidatus Poribacteria bacterium]MDQ1327672.1 dependent protein [Candidatus Poribacteria bacterium]